MGSGSSSSHAEQTSKKIDARLRNEKQTMKMVIKLLVLGSSNSGKSTFIKQIKLLHHDGFSQQERKIYRDILRDNLLSYTCDVLEAMFQMDVAFGSSENEKFSLTLMNNMRTILHGEHFAVLYATNIKKLYNDTGFLAMLKRDNEFCLAGAAKYLFSRFDEMCEDDYIPTNRDILSVRLPTNGIIELNVVYKNVKICLVDVGGQKSQRRKWIHCFSNVTAVLFTVDMSSYDQTTDDYSKESVTASASSKDQFHIYQSHRNCVGKPKTNRLHEAIGLFKSIAENHHFKEASFILFLNKKDLLESKIQNVPLSVCFPDYQGSNTYKEASSFIQKRVLRSAARQDVYAHHTNATDTTNIDAVFNSVMAIILKSNLTETGFL